VAQLQSLLSAEAAAAIVEKRPFQTRKEFIDWAASHEEYALRELAGTATSARLSRRNTIFQLP